MFTYTVTARYGISAPQTKLKTVHEHPRKNTCPPNNCNLDPRKKCPLNNYNLNKKTL